MTLDAKTLTVKSFFKFENIKSIYLSPFSDAFMVISFYKNTPNYKGDLIIDCKSLLKVFGLASRIVMAGRLFSKRDVPLSLVESCDIDLGNGSTKRIKFV